MLDIGDESDGVMESIQYEEEGEGEGEGEGEEEGWFIDSRLLQKDFIAKQYSLALFTYKKVSRDISLSLTLFTEQKRLNFLLVSIIVWKTEPTPMHCRRLYSSNFL